METKLSNINCCNFTRFSCVSKSDAFNYWLVIKAIENETRFSRKRKLTIVVETIVKETNVSKTGKIETRL